MDDRNFHLFEGDVEGVLPTDDSIGMKAVSDRINVFTEFCPIKSIIVGFMSDTSLISSTDAHFEDSNRDIKLGKEYPPEICQRARNFLNEASELLMKRGINVVRAAEIDHRELYEVDGVVSSGFQNFSARDVVFYYHDSAYEVPSPYVSR